MSGVESQRCCVLECISLPFHLHPALTALCFSLAKPTVPPSLRASLCLPLSSLFLSQCRAQIFVFKSGIMCLFLLHPILAHFPMKARVIVAFGEGIRLVLQEFVITPNEKRHLLTVPSFSFSSMMSDSAVNENIPLNEWFNVSVRLSPPATARLLSPSAISSAQSAAQPQHHTSLCLSVFAAFQLVFPLPPQELSLYYAHLQGFSHWATAMWWERIHSTSPSLLLPRKLDNQCQHWCPDCLGLRR